MKPLFHPQLVNDPFGDPGLYVGFQFENRALLFDAGDLSPLPPRKILKLSHLFISHTHMDHFIGFDQIVRICLGREKTLHLFGPPGLTDQVEHKLAAYSWNLVENYPSDFHVVVTEVDGPALRRSRFRSRAAFRREAAVRAPFQEGILVDAPAFRVRSVALDHKIPSMAYTVEEKQHLNILKNRLEEMGLSVGPWLKGLKEAVIRGDPDDTPIRVAREKKGEEGESGSSRFAGDLRGAWGASDHPEKQAFRGPRRRAATRASDGPPHLIEAREVPLGLLRKEIVRIVPGQKITYVTDAVYHRENAEKIVALAQGSDLLFIESTFPAEEIARAAQKYHLTTAQAGRLGREAGVKRLVPFHFSAKYNGEGRRLAAEVAAAFGAPAAMES